jgi:hypothetical protein
MSNDMGVPDLGLVMGNIGLRPVTDIDVDWLFQLETHPSIIRRFRLGGTTPSPSAYREFLKSSVLSQYLVVNIQRDERVGLVYGYNADLETGRASMGMVSHPDYDSDTARDFFRGVFLFVNYLFQHFPLRKIYGHAAEFNFVQYANRVDRSIDLQKMFEIEAVLPDHTFYAGRWWDKYIAGLSRDAWIEHLPIMLEQIRRDIEGVNSGDSVEHRRDEDFEATRNPVELDCLCTKDTRFRPIQSSDSKWLATTFLHPENRRYVRIPFPNTATVLTADALESLLWNGVLCQFVVEDRQNGIPFALMTAHKAEWNSLIMVMHVVADPALSSDSVLDQAIRHFVGHMFNIWPLRQIYFEYLSGAPIVNTIRRSLTDRGGHSQLRQVGTLGDWEVDRGMSQYGLDLFVISRERWTSVQSAHVAESLMPQARKMGAIQGAV